MIWFLLLVFVFALVMGYFQVPIGIMYGILAVMIIFFLIRNPLVFGKDPEKMLAYLKKSKAAHLQFLFHFLQGNLSCLGEYPLEKSATKLGIDALRERKEYGKAKVLLSKMSGHKTKWYALSDIAIQEEDTESFKQYKEKINDTFLLNMLEVDQAVFDGKRKEAVALLENMIPKLRGYKLLTAVQVRKQILEGKI
ncbi:hypothetical protein FB550_105311 [Neobacillus bataviensis]|uniref:Uncharacterized protein n=1 Tax=Neobacillus bataviensis TaxID=220685 RepID=A0A561DFI1_9BACI|nr:hypothetical protein [Neobacillus bataviensis]TWE01939.1 hypothetical protein FB550_105311 [Neobacillus bataviensis]